MTQIRSHPSIPCINQVFLQYLVSLTLKTDLHLAILQVVYPEKTFYKLSFKKKAKSIKQVRVAETGKFDLFPNWDKHYWMGKMKFIQNVFIRVTLTLN